MGSVSVVTESVANFPPGLAEKTGITIVPVSMVFGDRIFKDGVDPIEDFYSLLPRLSKLPTSSAPSTRDYLEAFRQAAREAEALVCLTIAFKLSAAYDAALLARD